MRRVLKKGISPRRNLSIAAELAATVYNVLIFLYSWLNYSEERTWGRIPPQI